MAVINRYTNQAIAQYNPMSMNELSFAPSYLREKHDFTEAALGELDEKSKLFGDILDQYGDPATQLAKPLQDDIVNLASSLSKQGVKRSNAIPEAMKLKSKYASLYGPQGDIGKLQSATAEYRNEVKRIQEQFKDSPELARGALARLNARQAQVNDGRLELGDMSSPQLYRHIKDEDIMKQLDSAANSLKPSDLAALKITSKANIGNFTDLLTLASQKGVTPDRLLQVMQSNISPEIRNSILQYAELVQNIPRDATIDLPTDDEGGTMKVQAGMVDFYDRMQRNAIAKAYTNADYKTVTTKDEVASGMALYRAKQELDNIPFIADGSFINVDAVNPYSDLIIGEDGNVKNNKLNPESWKGGANEVIKNPDGSFEVYELSGTGASKIKIFSSKDYRQNPQQTINGFKQLKANNPELVNLSDKEALEKVNDYFTNLTKQYGKVEKTSLDNPNFVKATLARGLNSSVFTAEGKQGDLTKLLNKNGYTDYNDYIEKNKNAYQGYRKFGPNGKIVHEFVLSDGTPFFIEGEDNIKNISEETFKFNQLIISTNTASNFEDAIIQTPDNEFVPVKEIKINPIATSSEPYSLKLVPKDSRVNLDDTLKSRLAGKTPKQVKEVLSSMGYNSNEYKIESYSEINREENDLINKTLKYMNK
jgi:hypothetical protein